MSNKQVKLGIVGVGKIVRDQHLPAIKNVGGYKLLATASRNASLPGISAYKHVDELLSESDVDAVSLCMPPQYRFDAAVAALKAGKHVLLEKPPGATVAEVEILRNLAQQRRLTLFASWHSRFAPAVETAKQILSTRVLESVTMTWKESVRKWHPGQDWIWQAGGLGVFDPGINGLSILTACLTEPAFVSEGELFFPKNKAAPISATVRLRTLSGISIQSDYDWDIEGDEQWTIEFKTDQGVVSLHDGGANLFVDGVAASVEQTSPHGEYEGIYRRFTKLIQTGSSDVDLAPLQLVSDAFLLSTHRQYDEFHEA